MQETVTWILGLPAVLVWICLGLASTIEYVFPPFPGDAIVLAGSVVSAHRGLDFIPVFFVVTLGSVVGAWLDFEVGCWLTKPKNTFVHRWFARPKVAVRIDRLVAAFERHGDRYLVINRFLPGVRALFFVAAGMAGFTRTRTLLIATAAATLWNGVILVVGAVIGANLADLLLFAQRYATAAWVLVIVACVVVFIRYRRRQRGTQTQDL